MELFLLPREIRCTVTAILLSAVKVDKDDGEVGTIICHAFTMCLILIS